MSAELDDDLPLPKYAKRHVDWLAARRMFLEGKNLSEIARLVGTDRAVVSRRASAEGWTNPPDLFLAERLELNHER